MKKQVSHYRKLFISMMMMVMVVSVGLAQVKEKRDVSDFTELSVSNAFAIEISVGNTESLEIEADERYIDDIITEVRGGRLVIRIRDSRNTRRMRSSPRAYLTVKSLERIDVSGAVKLSTEDPIEGDKLEIEMSGASTLNMEVNVKELYIQASGACVINMEGEARDQTLRSSGATTYRAFDLVSEIADIRVNGAGSARVNVSDKLDVRASGASSISYKGSPSVSKSTSGASSVRRSN